MTNKLNLWQVNKFKLKITEEKKSSNTERNHLNVDGTVECVLEPQVLHKAKLKCERKQQTPYLFIL